MPLFIDDKRATIQEVIKLVTNKEVEPSKDGKPNDYKVKTQIVGEWGDPKKIWRFTVLASDVREDKDNPRKGIQVPNSKTFEAFYNVTNAAGETHTLRYADTNPRKAEKDRLVYSPEYIVIPARGYLEVRGNAELAIFCYYHTANTESGNNVPGGIKMFTTFIGQKRSAKNVEREKMLHRAKDLFLNPEKRLSEKDLITLANTFITKKVPNNFYSIDEMSEDELIEEFVRLCSVDPYRIWNLYLGIDNNYRKMITEFKTAKVLVFTPHDLAWSMPNGNGTMEIITSVPVKHDATEWIINFLIDDNRGYQKKLENMLENTKAKKQVAA